MRATMSAADLDAIKPEPGLCSYSAVGMSEQEEGPPGTAFPFSAKAEDGERSSVEEQRPSQPLLLLHGHRYPPLPGLTEVLRTALPLSVAGNRKSNGSH